MKTTILNITSLLAALAVIVFVAPSSGQSAAPSATPAPATPAPTTPTPVPLATPAPVSALQTARAIVPAAVLQADINAVPSTPQSLIQLLSTFIPLPNGVSPTKIRSVTVLITPSGGANVTVQYTTP